MEKTVIRSKKWEEKEDKMKKIIGILLCLCVSWGSVSEIALAATQNSTDTIVKEQQTEKTTKKKQKTIFIAAGHQERGMSSRELLAPGSSATKAK